MNIIPFRAEHLSQINMQERHRRTVSYLTPEYVQMLARGPAISAVADDRIIASTGILLQFPGLGSLWGLVSQDAGPHVVRMYRAACRFLEIPKLRRIEATVETDFEDGCRWLELLGFEREGRMTKYGPNSEDHYRYAGTGPRRLLN
jgi:hypothetical protein